jgi:Ras-related protein Rab-7A
LRAVPASESLRQRRPTATSTGSTSSGSAVTITPSLFAREQQETAITGNSSNESALTTPEENALDLPDPEGGSGSISSTGPPPPAERGPSLRFTSAKTGEGVKELFEHIAARVVRKMEYEEYFESRRLHYREASGVESIRLGTYNRRELKTLERVRSGCCT